jgi:hypothetical protein
MRARLAIQTILLALLVGCAPEFPECAVRCGGATGLLCPRGHVCAGDGFCYSSVNEAEALACGARDAGGRDGAFDDASFGDGGTPVCQDQFEPNEGTATGTMIGIPPQTTFSEPALSICPGSDRDIYLFSVSTSQRLVATVTITAGTPSGFAWELYNGEGTSQLAVGMLIGQEHRISTTIAAGSYLLFLYSPGTTEGTYDLAVQLTPP